MNDIKHKFYLWLFIVYVFETKKKKNLWNSQSEIFLLLYFQDIKDLSLTVNPAFTSGAETGDGYIDRQTAQYICPTTGIEMNGKFKFCFSWKCGCVVSERALKEVRDNICHKVCLKNRRKNN